MVNQTTLWYWLTMTLVCCCYGRNHGMCERGKFSPPHATKSKSTLNQHWHYQYNTGFSSTKNPSKVPDTFPYTTCTISKRNKWLEHGDSVHTWLRASYRLSYRFSRFNKMTVWPVSIHTFIRLIFRQTWKLTTFLVNNTTTQLTSVNM